MSEEGGGDEEGAEGDGKDEDGVDGVAHLNACGLRGRGRRWALGWGGGGAWEAYANVYVGLGARWEGRGKGEYAAVAKGACGSHLEARRRQRRAARDGEVEGGKAEGSEEDHSESNDDKEGGEVVEEPLGDLEGRHDPCGRVEREHEQSTEAHTEGASRIQQGLDSHDDGGEGVGACAAGGADIAGIAVAIDVYSQMAGEVCVLGGVARGLVCDEGVDAFRCDDLSTRRTRTHKQA